VHAIHAASKRDKPFTWHASTTTASFADIGYPGILSNCETCHATGTYDFSATASASALPNKQYRTVGTGKYDGTVAGSLAAFSISPYVTADNVKDYGAGFSIANATGVSTAAVGTTLVISPIATACFSCHDSALAQSHMTSNGGSIYEARTTALAKTEQCTLCHLAGKVADIKTMHAK
jgi:OmcA/MtrC family decaheme c-type cytochrome